MDAKLIWTKLLSTKRLGREGDPGFSDETRSEFDRDYDRIVFSSAFRRLKDKTQVFPLSRNDFTRTRLTHSIEAACVGRSLGRKIGDAMQSAGELPDSRIDIGSILAAACLAHDIGNPPFGHSGEAAIQSWAEQSLGIADDVGDASAEASDMASDGEQPARPKSIILDTAQQLQDLCEFEGNAQAMRVVTRLQLGRRRGGLQLTHATIGAMMKYPCGSLVDGKPRKKEQIEQKKFGYFVDDDALIVDGLQDLGMVAAGTGAFRRHPLAFLVEAADDICYAIIDLEDSVDQKLVDLESAIAILEPLAKRVETYSPSGYKGHSYLQWLRAYAIHGLVTACASAFRENAPSILDGTFNKSLVQATPAVDEYAAVKAEVARTAYVDSRVLAVELAGFQVIKGLLDIFVTALLTPDKKYSKKLLAIFPASYLGEQDREGDKRSALDKLSTYQRVLAATDYVSGMTDSFAVNLYQELSGIKLPE